MMSLSIINSIDSIHDADRITMKQALIAIENNDVGEFKQLFTSLAPEELASSGELLVAALELDRRVIALELIGRQVSVKCSNEDNSTCLMIAAKNNNLDCLEKILESDRSNINDTDTYGWTALMYACYYGHSDVTRALLLAGAEADIADNDHISSLIWAAGRGHIDCVSALIKIGRAKVNQVDRSGTTPLIWACRKGCTEAASLLLKAGANIDSIGMFGWSAVLVSVLGNHLETLKLLLQHKPNVNTCDIQRLTPLIMASKEGKVDIVRLLLKARAFVNLSDEYGHSALIHAVKGLHLEVVDLLLKQHADVDHSGLDKKTALFWAVEKANLRIVERILQSKPNLELVSKEGDTCLIRAVKMRKVAIVRVLLAHQARASTTDKNGDTALHVAIKLQSATMAQLILSNPKNQHLLNKPNKAKKSPLNLDLENSSPIFPTILELQTIDKVSSKDTSLSKSYSHKAIAEKEPINEEVEIKPAQSSSSLVKKLATALGTQSDHQSQMLV